MSRSRYYITPCCYCDTIYDLIRINNVSMCRDCRKFKKAKAQRIKNINLIDPKLPENWMKLSKESTERIINKYGAKTW